jgi:hypothetical protein
VKRDQDNEGELEIYSYSKSQEKASAKAKASRKPLGNSNPAARGPRRESLTKKASGKDASSQKPHQNHNRSMRVNGNENSPQKGLVHKRNSRKSEGTTPIKTAKRMSKPNVSTPNQMNKSKDNEGKNRNEQAKKYSRKSKELSKLPLKIISQDASLNGPREEYLNGEGLRNQESSPDNDEKYQLSVSKANKRYSNESLENEQTPNEDQEGFYSPVDNDGYVEDEEYESPAKAHARGDKIPISITTHQDNSGKGRSGRRLKKNSGIGGNGN